MKNKLYLTILFLFCSFGLQAQILYNIAKPESQEKQGLKSHRQINKKEIDLDPKTKSEKLNLDILKESTIEKYGNEYIARLKIQIKSDVLGYLSLRFRDVKLDNFSHVYVYTTDYKIVAGPIYKKNIGNSINILQIPGSELVVEAIYSDEKDVGLILSEVSFQTIDEVQNKKSGKLQDEGDDAHEVFCGSCNYGEVDWATGFEGSYGAGANEFLLSHANQLGVNDLNLEAARAACMVISMEDNDTGTGELELRGKPGTLMNFPNDENNDECGVGYIFMVYHTSLVQIIIQKSQDIMNYSPNTNEYTAAKDFLDDVIVRFNWHHKYGEPKYLKDYDGTEKEELWRETIDFDEVIDYCGVEAFAYTEANLGEEDIVILKMKNEPFYKEQHLGWSTREYVYDFEKFIFEIDKSKIHALGRLANQPTLVFNQHADENLDISDTQIGLDFGGTAHPDLEGWSGSQYIYYDTDDAQDYIGIGVIKRGGVKIFEGYTYDFIFDHEKVKKNPGFYYPVNVPESLKVNLFTAYLDDYINTSGTDNLKLNLVDDPNASSEDKKYYWIPSVENAEKCPSAETVSCSLDVTSYISYYYTNFGIYFRVDFDAIPATMFSSTDKPEGVRVYHDFGDQRTFYYENWANQEQIDDITNTTFQTQGIAYFFIPTEELYMYKKHYSPAFSSLDIKFDFYDANGRIYEVDCPDDEPNTISVPIDGTYTDPQGNTQERIIDCDFFDIRAVQTSVIGQSGCCLYRVEIFIPGPTEDLAALHNLLNDMTALTGNVKCFSSDDPGNDMGLSFSMDYEKGVIASEEFCVDSPGSIDIDFVFDDGDFRQNCIKSVSLACGGDSVDCCDEMKLKIDPVRGPDNIPSAFPAYIIYPYTTHYNCPGNFGNITVEYLDANSNVLSSKLFTGYNPNIFLTYPMIFEGPTDSAMIRITVVVGGVSCVSEYWYSAYF
jgi:hypothetical protein